MSNDNVGLIVKHFDYTFNFQFLKIIENIIDRIDTSKRGDELEEDILTAIDDELIYTEDQWEICKWYSTPQTCDFNQTLMDLIVDIEEILTDIIEQQEKDE